jgi:hypothetical protein
MSQHTTEHTDSDAFAQPPESETGISLSPSGSGGQLTLTQQSPLSAATVTLDAPIGDIWERIAATDEFQRALETAVTELVGDLLAGARARALEQYSVTALDGLYASAIAALADEDPVRDEWQEQALRLTREFGSAERSVVGLHAPAEEIANGPLAVLRTSEESPTVAIRIDNTFGELRADQRSDIVGLLADLANAIDLRIVATGRWQRKLAQEYREQLPGVSEQCSAGPSEGAIAETVSQARNALDPDGRKVRILRQLAKQTSETLSYNGLYALHEVSKGAVRQCLTASEESLADLGLVETFSRATGRGNAVELLAPGREFLDRLDAEIGRQQRLDAAVSETGNSSDDTRVTPPTHEAPHSPAAEAEGGAEQSGGGAGAADDRDANRHRLPHHHQVRSAARHRYAAAAGSATDGGITLVDHPIPEKTDRGEPHWYYDHENDRLFVGAEHDNPMKGWVCIALALADPRTFRHVLTPERFETGKLGDMLANHTDLLRNSRCLGYLKDANATADDYTTALLDAAEDLRELTKDWYHDNYENPKRFRATILREAHGLAGTMVHLLDLAGVDLVREFRLPNFARDYDESDRHDFAKTIAIGASIQSRYREFAAYRQLFEEREDKRESAIPPRVDADDPFGECIGSFVLVGKSVTSLADPLRRRLSNQEVHDDASEFGVRVPVEVADERRHFTHTVQTVCRQKSIRPTRAATSMLAALIGTPYDTAKALHNLGSETKAPNRNIRLDEVRYALSTLDTERILPEMSKPALSKIVHALLVADTPLVQSELAERASVSARSVRNHTAHLAAFDFVRETDAGWRFVLPLRGEGEHDERGDDILPWFVATSDEDDQGQDTFVRDVLAEVVHDLLPPDRYADPDDPVAGALFAEPGERIPALREAREWLDPWLSVVQMLRDENRGCTHAATECTPSCSETVVTVGVEPDQASLAAAAGGG